MWRENKGSSRHTKALRTVSALGLLAIAVSLVLVPKWSERRVSTLAAGDQGAACLVERPDVSFASLDGQYTFRVPVPGDSEYDDYLQMLAHPRVRSSLQNSPGYAMPYDPEWRSMVTGRREVAKHNLELHGGSKSLEQLGLAILAGLQQADDTILNEQRIDEGEFGTLLWPEFPQSRPFLKIPLWEAWGFNHAKGVAGMRAALQIYGHRKLELVDMRYNAVQEFCNFHLLEDVRIVARDIDTNELVELDIVPAVVQCKGSFKALNYSG